MEKQNSNNHDHRLDIMVPFTFLDSSSLIRRHQKELTVPPKYRFPKKQKNEIEWKENLTNLAKLDNDYYQRLLNLFNFGTCASIITMDAFNTIIPLNNERILRLFGTADNNKSMVTWGENISPFVYNKAIILITQANCVIADNMFFSLQIGITLKSIIQELCPLYTLSTTSETSESTNESILRYTPFEFIRMLTEMM